MAGTRERAQRRDAGGIRVGMRDLEGMRWCAEQGAMRLDHIAGLFAAIDGRPVSSDAARKTIDRWVQRGWAVSRPLLRNQPAFVWLTSAGARQVGSSLPVAEPALSTLEHTADVAAIRLSNRVAMPDASWRSERQIRATLPARTKDSKLPHLPDAEITIADGRMFAIERERVAKTVERTRTIMLGLLARKRDYDHPDESSLPPGATRYAGIVYYVSDAAASVVEQAARSLPAELVTRVQIVAWP